MGFVNLALDFELEEFEDWGCGPVFRVKGLIK